MNTDKLVSVIIPLYNAAAHIEATLTSIIRQDYSSIEIIVVDDASTDSSPAAAKRLLEGSGRDFQLIRHTQNCGVCAARNTGLYASHGSYILLCDNDDLTEKNFVSSLITEAEHKNADIVFCGIKQYYESDNTLIDDPVTFKPDSLSPAKYLDAWASRKLYLWSVWNFLFRRELITANGLKFHEGCRLGEDTEFVLKAIACASRVSYVDAMLYTYVHHAGQASTARKGDVMFKHIFLSRLRSCRFLLRHTQSRKVRDYVLCFYLPDVTVKQFTRCAAADDRDHFNRLKRTLKHKTLRKILLASAKFFAAAPALFLKSLMLLYAPDLYYLLRRGK